MESICARKPFGGDIIITTTMSITTFIRIARRCYDSNGTSILIIIWCGLKDYQYYPPIILLQNTSGARNCSYQSPIIPRACCSHRLELFGCGSAIASKIEVRGR